MYDDYMMWFTDRCSTRGDHEAWFDMFQALLLHLDLVCNVNTRRGPEEFCGFSCSI